MQDGKILKVKYDAYDDSEYSSVGRISRFVPDNKTVLDVGCSTGYLGRLLLKKGCTLYGIEGNPLAAGKAAEIYREVWVLDLDGFAGIKGTHPLFDIIVFGDILEHLKDPKRLLQQMRGLLKDDGRVIISLPNVANWSMRFHVLRGKFDYVPYGVLDETHLRFFHPDSAGEMLENAGFLIVDMDVTPGVDKLVPYKRFIHPLFGRFAWYRHLEYRLSRWRPGLFAHQMIFVAVKADRSDGTGKSPFMQESG